MESAMDVAGALSDRLEGTQEALKEVGKGKGDNSRLRWLEGQLRNIEKQLQHMLLDIEAGAPLSSLGFGFEDDFMTVMDELGVEISTLRSLIQTCLSLER